MSRTPAFHAGNKKGYQINWQPYFLGGVPKGISFGFAQDKFTLLSRIQCGMSRTPAFHAGNKKKLPD